MNNKILMVLVSVILAGNIYGQTMIDSLNDKENSSFLQDNYGFFNDVRAFSFNLLDSVDLEEGFNILGSTTFTSYNSTYAHGMNDESLWQGKGFNTYLTGGFEYRLGGFSAIVYPEFWFAENQDFAIVAPSEDQDSDYGYYIDDIDNPQRYGDEAVLFAGFGQTEIRYSWDKVTLGLSNQSIWIGPGIYNSLLLSNNAGGFPKIDIGLRDINTWIGEIELYVWWGILSESEYYDNDSTNDYNLFTGIHFDYEIPFIEGLTFGFNRTLTANFSDAGISSYGTLFVPFMSTVFGTDENDQRASVTLDWIFPSVGFNVYTEWARNDYQPSIRSILQFPQRTQAYTIGARQLVFKKQDKRVMVTFEITNLEISWDYTIDDPMRDGVSFYTHAIVDQGYTQDGQILGAGIGTGSDSQTLRMDYYNGRGMLSAYVQRIARNKDYLFSLAEGSDERDSSYNNVELTFGTEWDFRFSDNQYFTTIIEISRNLNWNYIAGNDVTNFYGKIGYTIEL